MSTNLNGGSEIARSDIPYLDEALRRQKILNPQTAAIIGEQTGRSARAVIARAVVLQMDGKVHFDPNSKMTRSEAERAYIPLREKSAAKSSLVWKLAPIILVLAMVALFKACSSDREVSKPGSVSSNYARCEADLKPKVEKCLQGPQSVWEACGDAYMRELKSCVS